VVRTQLGKVKSTIIRQGFITLITSGLGFALTMGSGILLARLLGPAGKGTYSLAIALPNVVGTVGTLGLSYSCIRLLGEQKYPRRAIVSTALTWALGWGMLLALAGWLSYGYLKNNFLQGVDLVAFGLGLLIIPTYLLNESAGQSLRGIKLISGFNLNWLMQFGLRFLGLWLVLGVWHLGVQGAVLARVVSALIPLAISLIMLYRSVPFSLGVDKAILRDILTFGFKLSVTHSLLTLTYDVDLFIINYFSVGAAQIGYYTLAVSIAELVWYVSEAVMIVMLPYIASAAESDKARLAATTCRNAVLLTTLSGLGLAVVSRPIIALVYGEAFLPAAVPFLVLLPGAITMVIFRVLYDYLLISRDPLYVGIATGAAMVINVVANFFLIPRLGIVGASLASVISYTVTSVIAVYLFKRTAPIPLREILWPTAGDWREYTRLLGRLLRRRASVAADEIS
jgi:O-antigen/teichoic acid export membrane protein